MTKVQTFPIGKTSAEKSLSIDLLRLVDTRMLIQANSGGGKSWLLRLIVERVAGKVQVVLLDPEGEFATLREKVDIALVGHGGEMAADVRSAALLAHKLAELRVSAIVDLYDLKLPDRRRFVRLFLESLMNVPRALWHPMLVILDECHLYAPEKSAGEAESTNAVISLMSQGRKRGFAGIISTQRLSKLHKDAAAESNNVFIGRTWLDIDKQRAGDLLGMNKADRQILRDLAPGEFYAFGPALSIPGVVHFQSDVVTTTHPKAGERHLLEIPQASAAILEIVKQIGDLPQQAAGEARTLEDAQRKIGELERQLRARPVQLEQQVQVRVEQVKVPVFADNQIETLTGFANVFTGSLQQLTGISADIRRAVNDAVQLKNATVRAIATPAPMRKSIPLAPKVVDEGGELRAGERKMLQALAVRYPARYTRSQVGLLSGFSPGGGTFSNYFGTLKRRGFILESRDDVEITQAGLDYLGADIPPRPETTEELLTMWRKSLRNGERGMLDALVEVYPSAISREELGNRTGFTHTGGTFGNYFGTLRRNGLIEIEGDEARASSTLFLEK